MNFINELKIKLFCNKVGVDEFGNGYFEEKPSKTKIKKRRFVVYKGQVEASKIPSQWHRWLHYTCNEAPININTHKSSWQRIHLPNLTGTTYKHSPLKNKDSKSTRKSVGSDYESWNPSN